MIPDETRQERLMAGLSHLAVLLPLAGAFVPLVVWLSQRRASPFLRVQALQALIYQAIGMAGYILYYAFSMAAGLSTIPLSLGMAATIDGGPGSSTAAGELLFALFFLVIGGLVIASLGIQCILWPVYIILGVWAGTRILQGHDFQYPLLGKWLNSLHLPKESTSSPAIAGKQ